MNANLKIGFLGAGQMATALAKGFLKAGLVTVENLIASDVLESARQKFAQNTGARVVTQNADVLRFSDAVIIAVKPPQVPEVLKDVRGAYTGHQLFISIAAGVTLARLAEHLPANARIIRAMPNTPALVGTSATAYAASANATGDDLELAQKLFSSVGLAFALKEQLLDAVTGLSGSGPAYLFLVIEALSDGGVAAGLPREVATRLAAQPVKGAAEMVLATGLHPAVLKEQVTSPGGTTIEGLHELEKAATRAAFISAVRAAADKAKKLGAG